MTRCLDPSFWLLHGVAIVLLSLRFASHRHPHAEAKQRRWKKAQLLHSSGGGEGELHEGYLFYKKVTTLVGVHERTALKKSTLFHQTVV